MAQATDPITILVVEDEAVIRMCTASTLEDAGFRVLGADCSAEAIEILSCHAEISILMTDVHMPGQMNGLGLVAQVRRDHPDIRAIVVSGNTSAADASMAGATGFLAKPFLAQTMIQAVNDTIKRHLAGPRAA
ncbi:MAG: hypothetical protein RJB58_2012 [Pseudomonadota bacterium]|jgi:DNA-binding NtrC family response regulator